MRLRQLTQLWRRWTAARSVPAVDQPSDDPRIDRQRLFDELDQLERAFAAEVAARQHQAATIHAEIEQAEATLAGLRARLATLEQHRLTRSFEVGRRADQLRAAIAEQAPGEITDFLAKIGSELEYWRRIQPEIRPDGSDRDDTLIRKTPRFLSNAGSIKRRICALQAAREEVEALRIAPCSEADILSRLQRLERDLPTVGLEAVRGRAALVM